MRFRRLFDRGPGRAAFRIFSEDLVEEPADVEEDIGSDDLEDDAEDDDDGEGEDEADPFINDDGEPEDEEWAPDEVEIPADPPPAPEAAAGADRTLHLQSGPGRYRIELRKTRRRMSLDLLVDGEASLIPPEGWEAEIVESPPEPPPYALAVLMPGDTAAHSAVADGSKRPRQAADDLDETARPHKRKRPT